MNPLYETLPKNIKIDGTIYPIKTDFRAVLKLIREIKQTEEPAERLLFIFGMFRKKVPVDIPAAVQAVMDFIAGIQPDGQEENGQTKRRTFSYEKDAPYIISDFRNYYGIDLLDCKYLHWQKFQMLLSGLPDDSAVKTRIGYRSIDAGRIRDSQERQRILKIQREISLEDEDDGEWTSERFADAMWGDG